MSDQPDNKYEDLIEDAGTKIPEWYRKIWAVLFPLVIISVLVSAFGRPTWEPFNLIPDVVFKVVLLVGFVAFMPLLFSAQESQRQQNLKLYDPKAPEIQQLARSWQRKGYFAIAVVVTAFLSIVVAPDLLLNVPSWLLISSLVILIFVAVIGFMRSNDIRNGAWIPPEWMPPMKSSDDNESKSNDK